MNNIYRKYLECNKVVINSREVDVEDMFVAIKGDNHDANDFIPQALKYGAKYIISDDFEVCQKYDQAIFVKNSIVFLQELAYYHRKQLSIPIIGITGSNGKTTTKELCREVLGKKYKCYATKGNFNNHIGVPLSLLDIKKDHDIAIIEMGANHRGEIKFLSDICQPTHGIITNIGSAHLEGFGSLQGVIDTKTELYRKLEKENGTIFYNENSQLLKPLLPESTNNIGYGAEIEIGSSFPVLEVKINDIYYNSGLIGDYNATNIACAVKVGEYFDVEIEDIKHAIGNYSSKINRSQIIKIGDVTIISDAYNANPTSMKAAILNFTSLPFKKRVLVLGDMLELGSYSKDAHQEIISIIDDYDYNKVILVGEEFGRTAHSYLHFDNVDSLNKELPLLKLNTEAILLKGSRGIKLEQYIIE